MKQLKNIHSREVLATSAGGGYNTSKHHNGSNIRKHFYKRNRE